MFTGLVEEIGQIDIIIPSGNGIILKIRAEKILRDMQLGDSIAIDGVCLTVTDFSNSNFSVQVVGESLSRSTLRSKSVASRVNLERAIRADSRFGGHFVQGHVDGIGEIVDIEPSSPGSWMIVRVPDNLSTFIVEKGSVAFDGTSLTVARCQANLISTAIIPRTEKGTILGEKKTGELVNVEVDILAKYINNFINPLKNELTVDKLKEYGF